MRGVSVCCCCTTQAGPLFVYIAYFVFGKSGIMEASAKVLNAVTTALGQIGRINDNMNITQVIDSLGIVLTSVTELRAIANSTGLTFETVNKTITQVYLCVNDTIATKKTHEVLNCFVKSTKTSTKLDPCATEKNWNALLLSILFLFSLVFVIVMSAVEKRKYRRNCCHGRPGAVVPLNMLDSYENRFGNAIAFGATTSYCLAVLFGDAGEILGVAWSQIIASAPGYVGIAFKFLATVLIAMTAYPLFFCMRTSHKLSGSVFGIFYASVWLILLLFKTIVFTTTCFSKENFGDAATRSIVMEVLVTLPQIVCLILLLFKFVLVLIKAIPKRLKKWDAAAEDLYDDFRENYMYRHVLNLLKRVEVSSKKLEAESFKSRLRKKAYQWKPDFKYSTRVISAFTVAGITIYILTVYLIWFVWLYLDIIFAAFVKSKDFQVFIVTHLGLDVSFVGKIRTHISLWVGCFYAAIIFAMIKTVLLFLNMLALYRRHIIRLRRGDRSWLPSAVRTLSASPPSLVAASMKYAGFQVAYAAWGFVMFAILLWLVFGIAVSFVLYPLFTGQSSIAFPFIMKAWPPLVVSLIVAFSQRLAAMFFFLQQRGRVISIDNRNAFHIFSFFMFFFNIFLGVFSCLLRIIKGIIAGALFLERVQKSILPRSYEKMDPGYFAYIGYILIEHSHANPVLCVFFNLLNDHVKQTQKSLDESRMDFPETVSNKAFEMSDSKSGDEILKDKQNEKENRWKIVRNRWNLAYSLINNPSLVKYRRKEEENEEETAEDELAGADKKILKERQALPVIAV